MRKIKIMKKMEKMKKMKKMKKNRSKIKQKIPKTINKLKI